MSISSHPSEKIDRNMKTGQRGVVRYLALSDYKKPVPRPTQPTGGVRFSEHPCTPMDMCVSASYITTTPIPMHTILYRGFSGPPIQPFVYRGFSGWGVYICEFTFVHI